MRNDNQNIRISILFFGATADAVGKRAVELDLANGSTVGEVVERLKQEMPGLGKHKLLIARNEEYVLPENVVEAGDELAVFTAVSGG